MYINLFVQQVNDVIEMNTPVMLERQVDYIYIYLKDVIYYQLNK